MRAQVSDRSKSRLRVSRRGFLKASGVGAAVAASGTIGSVPFAASKAAAQNGWDAEHDVVVVGSGFAALAAAATARASGSDVVMYEKGAYVGGTSLVSGGGLWIPNNHLMHEEGIEDPREDALKYMARYSWPHLYNPDHETLGLPQHDFDMISTYYDAGAEAMVYLEEAGVTEWGISYGTPVQYMDHFEENKVSEAGRAVRVLGPDGEIGNGGTLIGNFQAWIEENGVGLHLLHRVERLVLNDAGEVVGVEVGVVDPEDAADAEASPEATPVVSSNILAIRARKGVIFGSGGFARNDDFMHNLMPEPYYGGCSAPTNEGDFLRISSSVNAKLGNLHNVWRNEGIFEQAIADTGAYNCVFFLSGDSFLQVNKNGRRYVNEKRNYQDRPRAHNDWDANNADWTNRLTFYVYDQRMQENWPSFPIPAEPETAPYVMVADTLEELAAVMEQRVEELRGVTGGVTLSDDFAANFVDEVARFNEFARTGEDLDFQRGSFPYDTEVPVAPTAEEPTIEYPSPDQANKAMYPLSDTGPYYAMIMAASAVDTNGGPVINTDAQVLTWDNKPVEGLYGAGSCIANPGRDAYWGGGATLGNCLVWGYRAGLHVHQASEKTV